MLISAHKEILRAESTEDVEKRHDLEFFQWFKELILYGEECPRDELRALAMGADNRVRRYTGCTVNGFIFHTHEREKERKTQNSGVVVKGEHGASELDFYGVVQDIIEVDYLLGQKRVVLFKCDWWNVGDNLGIKVDKECTITSINVSRKWYEDQPYVFASQVEQVFYLQDMKLGGSWFVVEKFSPRGSFDVPEQDNEKILEDAFQEDEQSELIVVNEVDGTSSLSRDGIIPIKDIYIAMPLPEHIDSDSDSFIDDSDDSDIGEAGGSDIDSSEEKSIYEEDLSD